MVQTAAQPMSVEEYIQYELRSERRHECIDGKLFEMPGEKDINNELVGEFYSLFKALLRPKGFQVFMNDVKVAIPDSARYYYPDVFLTAEPKTPDNQYIKRSPVLIVEVVSPGSQTQDYVHKYLDYTKIPSLEYYLIAEPETVLITVYERDGDEWVARKYTRLEDVVELPRLGVELRLGEVYSDH